MGRDVDWVIVVQAGGGGVGLETTVSEWDVRRQARDGVVGMRKWELRLYGLSSVVLEDDGAKGCNRGRELEASRGSSSVDYI